MSFLSKAAMSVAVAAAALTFVGPATANAERGPDGALWGAIAVETVGDYAHYIRTWNYPDRGSAEAAALEKCVARGCKVLTSFANGCGSVAESEDGKRWHGGNGATVAESEQDALNRLSGIKPQLPFPFTGSSSPERGVIKMTQCTD